MEESTALDLRRIPQIGAKISGYILHPTTRQTDIVKYMVF